MKKQTKETSHKKEETAVLVGVINDLQKEEQAIEYLDELEFLTLTAGAKTLKRFMQKLPSPDSKTFIRKGKLEEIQEYVEEKEIDMVVFDDDLSPSQLNNIQKAINKVKVLDRTNLILDIFADRAQTAQARAQVELAQMEYILPRLKGMWTHLERQKGGIGMRGPGETEIETDRRIVRTKISRLKERLEKIDKQSMTQRKTRGDLIRVALVGYTNVGKSTLLNLLSKSDILAENKLFATLDTTVRKVVFERMPFLLSDTVGFIRKLPHNLVESFKSTLDEVREADILIHVVDVSHPNYEDHIDVVNKTLDSIGVPENKPTILVFNKLDRYEEVQLDEYLDEKTKKALIEDLKNSWLAKSTKNSVFISAQEKININELRELMYKLIKKAYQERYPYKSEMF